MMDKQQALDEFCDRMICLIFWAHIRDMVDHEALRQMCHLVFVAHDDIEDR